MQLPTILMISYAIGMIPSAYFIVRAFTGKDIRTLGTGNVGTMNTILSSGALLGIITLLMDLVKGYAVVAITMRYAGSSHLWTVSLLFAVAAHNFNPLLGFSGGKGLATIAGGLFVVAPWMNLAILLFCGVLLLILRKPRVVPGIGMFFYPIILMLFGPSEGYLLGAIAMSVIVIMKHIPTFKETYCSPTDLREQHNE